MTHPHNPVIKEHRLKFAYAFEILDRTEQEKRIMHLTSEEFDLLVPHNAVRKALAYLEFRWDDERIKRIPPQPKEPNDE